MSAPASVSSLPVGLTLPRDLTLDWLEEMVERLEEEDVGLPQDRNLALMHEVGRPERILSLLRSGLPAGAVERIAARSYRHVNHFDKIVLVDSGRANNHRLTLHLWNPPYAPWELDDELIHDHRFSFWSTVLTGTLESQNFATAEDGPLYRGYQYTPEKLATSTLSNFYRFVGETHLRPTGTSRKSAGGTYFLWYERIHRVVLPETSMTCTLVLRGPRQRDHSTVYNTTYPTQQVQTTNEIFAPARLDSLLRALAEEMERGLRAG